MSVDQIAIGDYVSFKMNGYEPSRSGYWRAFGTVLRIVHGHLGVTPYTYYIVSMIGNPTSVHACEQKDREVRVESNNLTKEEL